MRVSGQDLIPPDNVGINRSLVSMVDGNLFDTLSFIAQNLRKSTERPFGGMQARSATVLTSST